MNGGGDEVIFRVQGESATMDWTVNPQSISFRDVLEVISRISPCTTVPAFEYEDEDGDRITVRTDEEMSIMISHYQGMLADGMVQPLLIYPRAKPQGRKNMHGLKVQTRKSSSSSMEPESASPMEVNSAGIINSAGSKKQESGNIEKILTCGSIVYEDLEFISVLGSGAAGTVHRAVHRPSNTTMAVKIISLDISQEEQKKIISELEILVRCKTPSIIGFYGAFFRENQIFMCTELMDGGSLENCGQIPEPVLGRIAVSVIKGLQYLWSLKIMHRDVKPSNILVNTAGQIKLCDFGVSVQLVNSIAKSYVGTNAYMAPERIKGEEYSIHSEVWSLGVSLYELAMGTFPYASATSSTAKPMDLINSIVNKVPPQLPSDRFTQEFVDFVSQCMKKELHTRPSPEALMTHPYIQMFNDGDSNNADIVAQWVVQHKQAMNTL